MIHDNTLRQYTNSLLVAVGRCRALAVSGKSMQSLERFARTSNEESSRSISINVLLELELELGVPLVTARMAEHLGYRVSPDLNCCVFTSDCATTTATHLSEQFAQLMNAYQIAISAGSMRRKDAARLRYEIDVLNNLLVGFKQYLSLSKD